MPPLLAVCLRRKARKLHWTRPARNALAFAEKKRVFRPGVARHYLDHESLKAILAQWNDEHQVAPSTGAIRWRSPDSSPSLAFQSSSRGTLLFIDIKINTHAEVKAKRNKESAGAVMKAKESSAVQRDIPARSAIVNYATRKKQDFTHSFWPFSRAAAARDRRLVAVVTRHREKCGAKHRSTRFSFIHISSMKKNKKKECVSRVIYTICFLFNALVFFTFSILLFDSSLIIKISFFFTWRRDF